MHYLNHDDVWQIDKDRRSRLHDEISRPRRLRPRPPADNVVSLPQRPSVGGQPPAA
jgi:hypothetical protein